MVERTLIWFVVSISYDRPRCLTTSVLDMTEHSHPDCQNCLFLNMQLAVITILPHTAPLSVLHVVVLLLKLQFQHFHKSYLLLKLRSPRDCSFVRSRLWHLHSPLDGASVRERIASRLAKRIKRTPSNKKLESFNLYCKY